MLMTGRQVLPGAEDEKFESRQVDGNWNIQQKHTGLVSDICSRNTYIGTYQVHLLNLQVTEGYC